MAYVIQAIALEVNSAVNFITTDEPITIFILALYTKIIEVLGMIPIGLRKLFLIMKISAEPGK